MIKYEDEAKIYKALSDLKLGYTPTELIIQYYTKFRMECIKQTYFKAKTKINQEMFDNLCKSVYNNYKIKGYSIDAIVNAIIHFCNINERPPTSIMLDCDVESLLEDYADE